MFEALKEKRREGYWGWDWKLIESNDPRDLKKRKCIRLINMQVKRWIQIVIAVMGSYITSLQLIKSGVKSPSRRRFLFQGDGELRRAGTKPEAWLGQKPSHSCFV